MSKGNQEETAPSGKQINIELSEDTAEGIYSNLVMLAHSSEEFILDFIRVMPGVPKARVKSRIIVTPQHAKRLLHALAENIDRFEQSHGEIDESRAQSPAVHFGVPGGEA
ncbi:MAG: hypothetical protein COV99_08000 [Bacteroidetes bacterium CG12_big_fil_rev_8_21_14_0_65_60_17]|nr:MAG: hypothetical protein COV99_08000 [Bacteroidetes bacterium CG12_big_fil_rev_8_21_14_0_65_60_17]